jgi:hypothetical protein
MINLDQGLGVNASCVVKHALRYDKPAGVGHTARGPAASLFVE